MGKNTNAMNTIRAIIELIQNIKSKSIKNKIELAVIIVKNKMRMNKYQYIY